MFEGGIGAILGSSFERAPWGWGVLALLVTAMVRLWPAMTKLSGERERSLLDARAHDNAELKDRVDALEQRLETDRARHDAEQARDRHKIANLNQCLDALLMMLELAPEKVAEHIAKIKAMRAEQQRRETAEAAAIRSATIVAAAGIKPEGLQT